MGSLLLGGADDEETLAWTHEPELAGLPHDELVGPGHGEPSGKLSRLALERGDLGLAAGDVFPGGAPGAEGLDIGDGDRREAGKREPAKREPGARRATAAGHGARFGGDLFAPSARVAREAD